MEHRIGLACAPDARRMEAQYAQAGRQDHGGGQPPAGGHQWRRVRICEGSGWQSHWSAAVNRINQVVLGALIALLCARPAGAELNSARRLHAFAKLANWTGVWERFNVGPADTPSDPTELA